MATYWGKMPIWLYILTCLYCLVPAILLYVGGQYISEPWILILVIHWVIMILIPWILVEILRIYNNTTVNWFYSSWGSSGDMHGIIMALVFCGLTVGLYWLFCGPLGMDMKGAVQMLPFPEDTLLKILAIAYFIIVKPHIEEFFWRRYNYELFPIDEMHFLLVSFFWALCYTVISILAGAEVLWACIVCLIFVALGRFLIWMRWQHGYFANYVVHMGICAGVVVCYFLADAGKF